MSECDYKLANANIKGKEKGGCLEFFFYIHFTTNGLYILDWPSPRYIKGYISIFGGNCPNVVNLTFPTPPPPGWQMKSMNVPIAKS
jgi:hypothetical protein